MNTEKIKIRMENGQTIEVVVLSKRASSIQIVLGEGIHSVKCELSPTRNGLAYAGSIMGRELVYERSRDQVQADIDAGRLAVLSFPWRKRARAQIGFVYKRQRTPLPSARAFMSLIRKRMKNVAA